MKFSFADLDLKALDAFAGDALVLTIGAERPLINLAALVDWRLCGRLSQMVRQGLFDGQSGEALLTPTHGRLRPPRLFCFGMGEEALSMGGFRGLARRILDATSRAGGKQVAASLPAHTFGDLPAAAAIWLDESSRVKIDQLLFGDARALHRAFALARETAGLSVELENPPVRTETGLRGVPSWSSKTAMVRS